MEWIETTGKTIDEARERALDLLGVTEDEIEIEIVEEPRSGLFGLVRGEARLRARIRPADMRTRTDRRRRPRGREDRGGRGSGERTATTVATIDDGGAEGGGTGRGSGGRSSGRGEGGRSERGGRDRGGRSGGSDRGGRSGGGRGSGRRDGDGGADGGDADRFERAEEADPAAVGAAAVQFMEGLVDAFGFQASVELLTDGVDLDLRADGSGLGLMVGSGGRTLLAIQDLARVAAQRRLGDHTTRLKVDIAGYRERRRQALEKFAREVAAQVRESGVPRAMEPMPSADRKVIHDVLVDEPGVSSRSEGDDPQRRVIVSPA